MPLMSALASSWQGASVAQSSEQASFTSEPVGSILATDSCEKNQSTLCRKSWVFCGFPPTGEVDRAGYDHS